MAELQIRVAGWAGNGVLMGIDGQFGRVTKTAVANFQTAYGLASDGVAGPIGWSNLTWYAGVCAISILASWLLYKFVEHPLERKLRGPR